MPKLGGRESGCAGREESSLVVIMYNVDGQHDRIEIRWNHGRPLGDHRFASIEVHILMDETRHGTESSFDHISSTIWYIGS